MWFLFLFVIYQVDQEGISSIHNIVKTLGEYSFSVLEIIGILIIILAAIYTLFYAIYQLLHSTEGSIVFQDTRHRLIRGILLGLDFLVAADIIRTVAIDLTFSSLGALAIIVLIRILLSFSLEVEMTGYWPWQKSRRQE